jgi:hypothetical protein
MKDNHRKIVLTISSAFIATLLLASCRPAHTSGYGFKISSSAGQASAFFECLYSTTTHACNISLQASPTGPVVHYSIASGGSQTLDNAPVGARYCASDSPMSWQSCPKSSVPDGSTTVESGTTVR